MGTSFQSAVRREMERRRLLLENVAKHATTALVDEVLQGAAAPIDTGAFMANMNASIGSPDASFSESKTDTDGVPTAMRIRQVIEQVRLGDKFYLTNGAPYGPFLEYGLYRQLKGYGQQTQRTINGFSTQAPHGVFRVSTEKWRDFVFNAVSECMNLTDAMTLQAPNFARAVTDRNISRHEYVSNYATKYEPMIHALKGKK